MQVNIVKNLSALYGNRQIFYFQHNCIPLSEIFTDLL
jgi:hypothetical protein